MNLRASIESANRWHKEASTPGRPLAVGDVIWYSAGGTVHTGTITKLGRHNHVHVDSSPLVIPPNWIVW